MTAIDVARELILGPAPVRESMGKNRSAMIDRMNQAVGIPLGSPYCAAGVSWCFRQVWRPGTPAFPYSGSSQAIRLAFRRKGLLFTDPQRLLSCKGAIGGWTNRDGVHGHVFLIQRRLVTAKGIVAAIGTLEFNTSPVTKDRDGEGGYALRRSVDERELWFCDTSQICGGDWWP